MADPVEGGLNFILEAIKISPVGVLVIPMGLGLILIVAEQFRATPRPSMLRTIWIYLGVCVFLAFGSVAYSLFTSEQRKALEYALESLNRQGEIYREYRGDDELIAHAYAVSPEVKEAWEKTEAALKKMAAEACNRKSGLQKRMAKLDGTEYVEAECIGSRRRFPG